jgi:tetratricopeptide (TPR) repeat protein
LLLGVEAASAQSAPTVSRPVVQAMPSAQSQRLNAALARIARDPRDIAALVDAGDAANAMGDPEAAAGFYKRADAIAPSNPRVKAGMARALVLQGDPVKAIPLFAQAEAGGGAGDVTADRGLAYDLVGDTATAQTYYRTAMARRDDDEVRRRLGISLAIAGDAAGAEAMLMPLLRKQDKPAWRSHAFALAIAGRTKEAVDTVNAILPGPLAQSVTPYLRYMPRLTRSQQAAAANLGKFPRASEIGRDDPAIAAYAPTPTRVAQVGAGLVPQGKALGSGRSRNAVTQRDAPEPLTRSQRRAQERAAQLARAEAAVAARVAPPEPRPGIASTDGELPPVSGTAPRQALASAQAPAPTRVAVIERPAPASPAAAAATGARLAAPEPVLSSPPRSQPSASVPSTPGATAFDLARVPSGNAAALTPAPSAAPAAIPTRAASTAEVVGPPPSPVSLEQIFADLGAPSREAVPVAGAVDILAVLPAKPQPTVIAPEPEKPAVKATAVRAPATKKPDEPKLAAADSAAAKKKTAEIAKAGKKAEPAEEVDAKKTGKKGDAKTADAKKADAKKAEAKKVPSHPSRIWVQIGVGRDKAAIAFDWRKFNKDHAAAFKGRQAYISDMGSTNRMLVGPFETQKAANGFLAQLKKADFARGFIWTSPAGQVVDALSGK